MVESTLIQSDLDKVKAHWSRQAGTWQVGRGVHWTEHPAVRARINCKVSGCAAEDAFQYLIKFLKQRGTTLPLGRCLTLGCGAGALERGLTQYDFCLRHDAYDVAERAIELARQAAETQGLTHIDYDVADVNKLVLPPQTYDVVFTPMSAHHFANLEGVFAQIKRSLTPGGVFFLNEFIGPARFQWTDRQLEVINGLLQVLPAKYRLTMDGRWKSNVPRPVAAEMEAVDPSEAVRSAEIVPLLSAFFRIVEKRDYGGTILHTLLEGIAGNFDPASERDRWWLGWLFEAEDQLLEMGDIPSDFSVLIAQ